MTQGNTRGKVYSMSTRTLPRFLTTRDAAAELGCSRCRVEQLILTKRLRAEKHGRDWVILPRALDAVRIRKNGRPPATKGSRQ